MLVFLLAALENDEDKKLFTEIYEQYRPQMESVDVSATVRTRSNPYYLIQAKS